MMYKRLAALKERLDARVARSEDSCPPIYISQL